jgi:putative transposase
LLLDRGCYSVSVVRYLQRARCPFLMPAPCKGRKADHPQGSGGTRVFYLRRRSGWSRYTLTDSKGQKATVPICVRCRQQSGVRQAPGPAALVYAFWGLRPSS